MSHWSGWKIAVNDTIEPAFPNTAIVDEEGHTIAENLTKERALEIIFMRQLALDLYCVVLDFLPNIGRCALQDYAKLNESLVQAERFFGVNPNKKEPDA